MTATEDHITPHIVRRDIDGLPFAYQRSILRTDPDRLGETLQEIKDIQERSTSSLKDLRIEPHRRKKRGFLELTGPSEVDALSVRDALREGGLKERVQVEPALISDDPNPKLVGMPVKHGHGTTRAGVYLVGVRPPARSKADPEAGRRPVVAVLDTPVREHDWLGDGSGDDAFWRDARDVEDGWMPNLEVPEESPDGLLVAAGHGTFIAGMVRQLAPEAHVLSIPVMDGNGAVEEELVLDALRWLRDRVEGTRNDRRNRFVDVVNLSFGRYPLDEQDPADIDELRTVLGNLARLGVRVVASAGNRSTETHVYPAAFSKDKSDASDDTRLISVGARDPDGTLATYTNTGDWVSVQAPGTSVVSALPKFDHVVWPPKNVDADEEAIGPDPNFQASGIGQWSGTSFATAWVSASIAAKLLEQATPGSLTDNSPQQAKARATTAWRAVRADLKRWTKDHGVVD
jgi:subtilisin family serine protease